MEDDWRVATPIKSIVIHELIKNDFPGCFSFFFFKKFIFKVGGFFESWEAWSIEPSVKTTLKKEKKIIVILMEMT